MTKANTGSQVSVHYTGTLSDGTVFDNSRERGSPLEFTLGSGDLIDGFDSAVSGMEVGEVKTITIPAADAYGLADPERKAPIPRAMFPPEVTLTEGLHVPLRGPSGENIVGRILTITEESVEVDLNHPLAGQDLTFEIELINLN